MTHSFPTRRSSDLKTIDLFAVARLAEGQADLGEFAGDGEYSQKGNTFPNGAHICEVEIDTDTGVYHVTRFTAVDDFGQILNPMLVAGQVHGGIVQGLGQAMGEIGRAPGRERGGTSV